MKRRFWAPGRVNLIGEHTDTTGGLALPIAIGRGVRLTVDPSDRISLVSEGAVIDVAADGTNNAAGWGVYVAAVAAELAKLGRPPVGITGAVEADLPRGAGLGSSAALEIAVAFALCAVAEFAVDPSELTQACRRAEFHAVGVPCGLLDQAASVFGRAGHALFLDCETLEHRHVPMPDRLAVMVIDSGERRELAGSAYAARLSDVQTALANFGGRRPRDIATAELRDAQHDPARRLRHVVTENERVLEAVAILEEGDVGRLGAVFAASHESLRANYEVSTPALDRLVDLALDEGAVAARMTGGGFGGSIVVLSERMNAQTLLERVVARAGPPAHGSIVEPSDGAREV